MVSSRSERLSIHSLNTRPAAPIRVRALDVLRAPRWSDGWCWPGILAGRVMSTAGPALNKAIEAAVVPSLHCRPQCGIYLFAPASERKCPAL
jgi:hypothetical protein